MMKHHATALITGALLLWCPLPVAADEASKLAKAGELLQLTQGDQMVRMMEPMITGMAGALKPDMPVEERARVVEAQKKMMALVADRLNAAKPALAKIYTETYTEEEIDGILSFYKSPVGRAMLQKMPEVMKRSAPVLVGLIGGLQSEIKKIAEEMRQ